MHLVAGSDLRPSGDQRGGQLISLLNGGPRDWTSCGNHRLSLRHGCRPGEQARSATLKAIHTLMNLIHLFLVCCQAPLPMSIQYGVVHVVSALHACYLALRADLSDWRTRFSACWGAVRAHLPQHSSHCFGAFRSDKHCPYGFCHSHCAGEAPVL